MRAIIFSALLVFTCFSLEAKQKTDQLSAPAKSDDASTSSAPWWVQRFKISVGGFFPVNNTELKVGSNDGKFGTSIDLEDDLGFKTTTNTFILDGQWRISRRSRLELAYYNINRAADRRLDRDIEFYDTTYHVGADVHAYFNTSIYQLSYGYAILSKPKYEAGLLFGFHIVGTQVGLKVNNSSGGSFSADNNFGFTAPLPDFGVWGGYAITDRFAFNGILCYLSFNSGGVGGNILSYNASLTYKVVSDFMLSLGYTGLSFNLNATDGKYGGTFKWGYNGPCIMASFGFGRKVW